jgi:type II restriction enzyme
MHNKEIEQKIKALVKKIPVLTSGQIIWLSRVIEVFEEPHSFQIFQSDIVDREVLFNFGDALRIHHSFSREPFTKDKFEYVLERILNSNGPVAALAAKGNPGHDISIKGERFSLKTQADKKICEDHIWISKFMELGKGEWGDDPGDLYGL